MEKPNVMTLFFLSMFATGVFAASPSAQDDREPTRNILLGSSAHYAVELSGATKPSPKHLEILNHISKELDPRVDSILAKADRYLSPAEAKRVRSAFPVKLILVSGVSLIAAESSPIQREISIGDRFDNSQYQGWTQIALHETGHVIAHQLGIRSSFWQEFWPDFIAASAFNLESRMFIGLERVSADLQREAALGGSAEDRALIETLIALGGRGAARDFAGKPDLEAIYETPHFYVISTHVNRWLQLVARSAGVAAVDQAGWQIMAAHGALLGNDLTMLTDAFAKKLDGRISGEALSLAEKLRPKPQNGLLSAQARVQSKNHVKITVKSSRPGSLLSVSSGARVIHATSMSEDAQAFNLRSDGDCEEDSESTRIDPRAPFTVEALVVREDGLGKERIDLTASLSKIRKDGCWIFHPF